MCTKFVIFFKIMMWKFGKSLNFCLSSSLHIFRLCTNIFCAALNVFLAAKINSVRFVFMLVPVVVDSIFVSDFACSAEHTEFGFLLEVSDLVISSCTA
jgi:hypothetical protein